jgi:AcrR family transcriptional regulator
MIELSADLGYESITVRSLTRLAGVSTRSFYKHFANAEECFAYTYQSLIEDGLRLARAARNGSDDPERAVRASLGSLGVELAKDPKASQVVLFEVFAAGPAMRTRRREATAGFERLLGEALAGGHEAVAAPSRILGGIAAGAMRVARTRLLAGDGPEPTALAAALGEWMLALPSRYAPPELPDRDLFSSARNGAEHREDPGPTILGGVGEERGRILSAAVKLAATGGFGNLRIPRIRAEAGVSRRSFDARFDDVEECFLEAVEAIVASAASRAKAEARGAPSWERGMHRGIRALCTEAASNPALARLAFVDIFAPGREGLRRRERLVSLAAERLRGSAPPERRPSELVAEASAAAAWKIAHAEVAAGRAKDLPWHLPLLSYVVLAPVIGPAAAAEVIRTEEAQPVRLS